MNILNLNQDDILEICKWQYPAPYNIYNYPTYDILVEQKWAIADEVKCQEQFRKIVDDNKNFLGYFRFQNQNNKILLGLGLNPIFCNKGLGTIFVKKILEYLKKQNKIIEIEVRKFNIRAIKCYQKAGFIIKDQIIKETLIGKDEFVIMQYSYK